jgi:hypothetical protein
MTKCIYRLFIIIIVCTFAFSCSKTTGKEVIDEMLSDDLFDNKLRVAQTNCLTDNQWLLTMLRFDNVKHNNKMSSDYYLKDGKIDTLIFEFKVDNTIFVNNECCGSWHIFSKKLNDGQFLSVIKLDMIAEYLDILKIPDENLLYGFYGNRKKLHFVSNKNNWRMVFTRITRNNVMGNISDVEL